MPRPIVRTAAAVLKALASPAAALLLTAGCLPLPQTQSPTDITGLKFVAAERARDRAARQQSELPPQLQGLFQKIEIKNGQARLPLEEAVRRTLRSGLGIQIASYTPALAEADVIAAESVFDPVYFLQGTMFKQDEPVNSFLAAGGNSALMQDERKVSTGLRKTMASGASITVSENVDYLHSNSPFLTTPSYATNFMVELSQPILKNMGLNATKAQIYIASHNRNSSIEDFRKQVIDSLSDLESTYWQLVFARGDVVVRRQSVALAEEVYRKEKARADQQLSRKLDLARARSTATSRRVELIRAQALVQNLSDRLKNIINDPELDLREAVEIVPADQPVQLEPPADWAESVMRAMEMRPEIRAAREQLEAQGVRRRYYQNQLLPRLDVSFLWRRNSLNTEGDESFSDQFTGRFTDYQTGLVFEAPIGNRLGEAQYRRSKIEYQQLVTRLEQVTEQAVLEVNVAMRELTTNREEIKATAIAREAALETMTGEQARYEVGDVSNFDLLVAQREYEDAQRNELQAITRFNISIIELERAKGSLLEYNNIHVLPKDYHDPKTRDTKVQTCLREGSDAQVK